jgi:hypothetical protein
MKVAQKSRLSLVGMIGLCILTSGCNGLDENLVAQFEQEIEWWKNHSSCNSGCNHNHNHDNDNNGGGNQTPVCEIKEFKKKFAVRKFTQNEKESVRDLPYNKCDVPTLDIDEGNKLLKSCRKGCDLGDHHALTNTPSNNCSNSCTFPIAEQKYVKDAMVVFAADLENLPAKDKITEVVAANLNLTLAQKDENQLIGELLCIIGSGVCSGEYDFGWVGQKINAEFFKTHDIVNNYFSKIMLKKQLRCKEERRTCAADVDAFGDVLALTGTNSCTASHVLWYDYVKMKIEDLIAGSNKSVLDIIYGDKNIITKKTLQFVIADDVYVPSKDGYVELSLKYESCTVPPQPCPSTSPSPTPTPTASPSPSPTPTPPIGT